ncbi:hypothetical protein [Mastigocoleus testarum]|uniref:hypothetical protein n=1 Tax=Mastigocoleus testarum TaxID=996925 RepID=UPI00128EC5FB|nr:hypothetical protein [Mastigocoleus testarum]
MTGINSKSAAISQFISSKIIYSQQLVAQSSTSNTQTEGVFNNEPIIQEKTSDTQSSSRDSEFYNLFTPILCTLLGYAAGSVVGSKNQRERVKERVPSEN